MEYTDTTNNTLENVEVSMIRDTTVINNGNAESPVKVEDGLAMTKSAVKLSNFKLNMGSGGIAVGTVSPTAMRKDAANAQKSHHKKRKVRTSMRK